MKEEKETEKERANKGQTSSSIFMTREEISPKTYMKSVVLMIIRSRQKTISNMVSGTSSPTFPSDDRVAST
jgi:hypothetical protein